MLPSSPRHDAPAQAATDSSESQNNAMPSSNAVRNASICSTKDLMDFISTLDEQQQCSNDETPSISLVMPGDHHVSASFYVGVVAELMRRGVLRQVQMIYAQGASALLACYIWRHWDTLSTVHNPEEIQSQWVEPMSRLLTKPVQQIEVELELCGLGVTDVWLHPEDKQIPPVIELFRRSTVLLPSHDNNNDEKKKYQSTKYGAAMEHYTYHQCSGTSFTDLILRILFDPTCTQVPTASKQCIIQPSMWDRVSRDYNAMWVGTPAHISFLSEAIPESEIALYDEVRRLLSGNSQSLETILPIALPFYTHHSNGEDVASNNTIRTRELTLQQDAGLHDHTGLQHDMFIQSFKWGQTVVSRKLSLLRQLGYRDLRLHPAPGTGTGFTSKQRRRMLGLTTKLRSHSWADISVDSAHFQSLNTLTESDFTSISRDLKVFGGGGDSKRSDTSLHRADRRWEQSKVEREQQWRQDINADELSSHLQVFRGYMHGDDDEEYTYPDDTDLYDMDMEGLAVLQSHDDSNSNLIGRAGATRSFCQTFCSRFFQQPKVDTMTLKPSCSVPVLALDGKQQCNQEEEEEYGDDEFESAFDAPIYSIQHDGPTITAASRANKRHTDVLKRAATPRL
jgi:hypothetical protein